MQTGESKCGILSALYLRSFVRIDSYYFCKYKVYIHGYTEVIV